jgi:hypothetical protein
VLSRPRRSPNGHGLSAANPPIRQQEMGAYRRDPLELIGHDCFGNHAHEAPAPNSVFVERLQHRPETRPAAGRERGHRPSSADQTGSKAGTRSCRSAAPCRRAGRRKIHVTPLRCAHALGSRRNTPPRRHSGWRGHRPSVPRTTCLPIAAISSGVILKVARSILRSRPQSISRSSGSKPTLPS